MMALMARRMPCVLLAVVLGTVAVAVALDALTGSCAGLAHLLPFILVVVPLLAGRFPGEQRLARLAGLLPAPRRRAMRTCPSARPARCCVPRGGCLIASFLAVRPPPHRTSLLV